MIWAILNLGFTDAFMRTDIALSSLPQGNTQETKTECTVAKHTCVCLQENTTASVYNKLMSLISTDAIRMKTVFGVMYTTGVSAQQHNNCDIRRACCYISDFPVWHRRADKVPGDGVTRSGRGQVRQLVLGSVPYWLAATSATPCSDSSHVDAT